MPGRESRKDPQRWSSSNRGARLPSNWPQLRRFVLERDGHRCTATDGAGRCPELATDVDHVVPGDDHRPSNLTALCGPHHAAKSSREGTAARWAPQQRATRPRERHPGLNG